MIKLIWYNTYIHRDESYGHWSANMTDYHVFYEEDWKINKVELINTYWDCCSWWTSATWWAMKITEIDKVGTLQYVAIKWFVADNIMDVVYCDKNWWDNYYPSWSTWIRKWFIHMFTETWRQKENRIVYVFRWESWIWKSYIWSKITWLNVFETDSLSEWDFSWSIIDKSDVIILWNKNKITLEDYISDAQLVYVDFHY